MQKTVRYKNSRGMEIVGVLHYNKNKVRPGIIVSHGFLSSRKNGLIKKIANTLYTNGFAVLRFDYSGGIGESGGSMADVSVAQQIDDLERAVDFMEDNRHVSKKTDIGLVGHSLGGALSMEVASKDKRIGALVMISSPANFHFQHIFREGFWELITETLPERVYSKTPRLRDVLHFYDDAKKHDCLRIAEKIEIPTLFIHGNRDVIVPLQSSKVMFDKIGDEKDLRILKRANHGFLLKSVSTSAANYCVEWMKKYIKED